MDARSRCDVAIIGAGIAGLTSAALLSRAGLRVIVFEAEPHPGGCLQSFHRNGFTFDTSIEWLSQCRSGGFLSRIHHHLGSDGPRYQALNRINRHKSSRHDYLLTTNPLVFRDQLIRDFPADAQGLQSLFRDAENLGHHLRRLDNRMRSIETMSAPEKLRYGLSMLRWVWPIRRFASTTATQGLSRYFKTDELRDLFYSDDSLLSVLIPIGMAFTADFQKPPPGGGSAMVDWLLGKIAADGGTLCLNQRVERILINARGEAEGVRLASGQEILSCHVIAACDAETLFTRMVPSGRISVRWARRLREADVYYSSFTIYLGLNCSATSLGLNEELVRLTDPAFPPSERARGEAQSTVITLLSPSFRDPSLAPDGKATLVIQCPAFLAYHNAWETGPGLERGEPYRRLKQAFADALLDRVEHDLLPGLRKHIEVMEIGSPVTFLRHTGNRGGSIMGHRPTRKNIRSRLARIQTPIRRLWLGGQWAEYGGGIPMATKAAVNASLLVLRELRPDAYSSLKAVVDGLESPPNQNPANPLPLHANKPDVQ